MGDLSESLTLPGCWRLDAVRIDSLTGCRGGGWELKTLSQSCARGLRKSVYHHGKAGAEMCLFDKNRTALSRNADRARKWAARSGRFGTNSTSEPPTLPSDAPPDGTSDEGDSPALQPHSDRFGGDTAGKFRGNPAGRRQRYQVQRGLRGDASLGFARGFP